MILKEVRIADKDGNILWSQEDVTVKEGEILQICLEGSAEDHPPFGLGKPGAGLGDLTK